MEREICELFVTWHWFCGPLLWLWQRVALYSLPCGLWTNGNMTPGRGLLAWHFLDQTATRLKD